VFSLGNLDCDTNKTDRHDKTDMLLKVALNTITITLLLARIIKLQSNLIISDKLFPSIPRNSYTVRLQYMIAKSPPHNSNKKYLNPPLLIKVPVPIQKSEDYIYVW